MKDNSLCDLGFIGLGVMGSNLVLNLADNGYKVACFDLDKPKIAAIESIDREQRGNAKPRVFGCDSFTTLLSSLKVPHLLMLSVPAGDAVDNACEHLISAGIKANDIVIDTGNSLWTDTQQREQKYKSHFIFFSTAVSGGEVGARFGPSLMPSGDPYAWTRIEDMFKAIAAKVDANTGKPIERTQPYKPVTEGEPCAAYIGASGSGHYVKMVHNGIEYGDMQLICESYHILREGLKLEPEAIADIFEQWNNGLLDSYLMEISIEVLRHKDTETGKPLVDVILDSAGQKGTGLWTAISALEFGSPAQSIAQAVFARSMSSFKTQRTIASKLLQGPEVATYTQAEKGKMIDELRDALYCSKVCVYAQGFQLMLIASKEKAWDLNFAAIAKIWRAGCIIRAVFLEDINRAFKENENLENLLLNPFFNQQIVRLQSNWRKSIANAALMGIPHPAMSSALAYYDSYRCEVLPANLLQAQRDFFGAHTFSRVDKPSQKKFHVEWASQSREMKAL